MCIWNARWTCVSMFCWKLWVSCTVHGTHKYRIQQKKTFKTGSHMVLFTFKNYFATVFSVFSNKRHPNKPKCLNFVLEISQNTCSLFKYKSSCRFNLVYYPHLFLKKQKKIIIYYNLCNLWHKLNSLGRLLYFYFVINNHAI